MGSGARFPRMHWGYQPVNCLFMKEGHARPTLPVNIQIVIIWAVTLLSQVLVCLHLRLSTSCITSLIFTANASSSNPNHSNFSSTSRYFTPADHDRSHSRHPVQDQYTFGPASTGYDHNTGYGYDSPGKRGKYEARVNQRKARYSRPYVYVPPHLQVDLGPLCAHDFPRSRAWKKDHEGLVSLTKSTAVRRPTHHRTVRPRIHAP